MTISELITPYKVDRKEVIMVIDNFLYTDDSNIWPNESKFKMILTHLQNVDIDMFNSINESIYRSKDNSTVLIIKPDRLINKMKYEFLINNIDNIKLEDLENLVK